MPWIKTVLAEEAEGDLKDVFVARKIERGRMFTPYEVFTLNGPALKTLDTMQTVIRFGPSDLSRVQRELIAAYVSALNDCTF
jgi:alkylhydroperoxidase family enzyme